MKSGVASNVLQVHSDLSFDRFQRALLKNQRNLRLWRKSPADQTADLGLADISSEFGYPMKPLC
jgi:hypothetical protein